MRACKGGMFTLPVTVSESERVYKPATMPSLPAAAKPALVGITFAIVKSNAVKARVLPAKDSLAPKPRVVPPSRPAKSKSPESVLPNM